MSLYHCINFRLLGLIYFNFIVVHFIYYNNIFYFKCNSILTYLVTNMQTINDETLDAIDAFGLNYGELSYE